MNDNEKVLIAGLKALAACDSRCPPQRLEALLLIKVAPPKKISWPIVLEAFAAAAIFAIAILSRSSAPVVANDFVTVPYSDPIGPNERAELVRVNLPVAALAQWGFPTSNFDPR